MNKEERKLEELKRKAELYDKIVNLKENVIYSGRRSGKQLSLLKYVVLKSEAFDILSKVFSDSDYCNMQLYGNESTDTYLILAWPRRGDSIEYEITRNEFDILRESGVKVCNFKLKEEQDV